MELTALVGIVCTIIGCIIGIYGFKRNEKNDLKIETKEDTREKVQLNTKIDILLANNTEIKGEIRDINNKFDNFKDTFSERLTRVEESIKQAHKRIDEIKKK